MLKFSESMKEVSLEDKTRELMEQTEDFINKAVKASGVSASDILLNMDAETGTMIGCCAELWKTCKEYSIFQAKRLDETLQIVKELKEENKIMRRMLQTLDEKTAD